MHMYWSYCGGGPLSAGIIAIGSVTGNDLVVLVVVGSTVLSGVGSAAVTGGMATVDSVFAMVNSPSAAR